MNAKKRFVPRERKEDVHFLEGEPSADRQAIHFPIALLKPGNNPRHDLGDLSELSESIKRWGVLQSVLVAKSKDGKLIIVAGNRRVQAAKNAGLETIPCRLIDADEDAAAIVAMVENVQRLDLEPIGEILGIAKLVHIFQGNQVELAEALGKSKSYVSKCLKAAEFIREHKVSDPKLSKSMLLELPYSADPKAALASVDQGAVTSSKEVRDPRKPSGAIPGGRYGAEGAIQFKERQDGKGFSLRLNWDLERTPPESKEKIISTLETILQKLRGR